MTDLLIILAIVAVLGVLTQLKRIFKKKEFPPEIDMRKGRMNQRFRK